LLWLIRTRQVRNFAAVCVGFAIPVLVANVPLLIFDKSDLTAAYTTQTGRTVTAESLVYLPLRLFWHARPGYWYFGTADVPAQANRAAVWLQILTVATIIVLTVLARTRRAAVALAALVPAVFFLTNRIFSPQFFVLVMSAICVATALVARTWPEVLAIAASCAVAMTANTVLFQSMLGIHPVGTEPGWTYVSAVSFLPAVVVVIWLSVRALLQYETPALSRALPVPASR
jgi:hypothetical protein